MTGGHRAQRDGPHDVTEGRSSYTVKLATEPTGEVTVTISGHAGTDLTLDKTTLTFTVDNWATAQTVTVRRAQDDDGSADTATVTHTASGGDYARHRRPADGHRRRQCAIELGAERCGGPEQRVHGDWPPSRRAT